MVSEDYRFFMKKLKNQEEIIYDDMIQIDDTERIQIIEKNGEAQIEKVQEPEDISDFTFLEALAKQRDTPIEEEKIELSLDETYVVEQFQKAYVLQEQVTPENLFGITNEYPDTYVEWGNKYLNLYIFPTKNYNEIQDIFDVLSFELPYTINEVNNFWEKSFYINMNTGFEDDFIRIVFQYKKRAF
mgnify:FL=1